MHLSHYPIEIAESGFAYDFVSEGPKGRIRKAVVFETTSVPNLYNLAFGDLADDGTTIDDFARTDNGDMRKVLSTVATIVYDFCWIHPEAMVLATGSTPERTHLYQKSIRNNLVWLQEYFDVFGFSEGRWLSFEVSIDYEAFYVKRKT